MEGTRKVGFPGNMRGIRVDHGCMLRWRQARLSAHLGDDLPPASIVWSERVAAGLPLDWGMVYSLAVPVGTPAPSSPTLPSSPEDSRMS